MTEEQLKCKYETQRLRCEISESFSEAFEEAQKYGTEWEIKAIQYINEPGCVGSRKCLYRAFSDTEDPETIQRVLRLCLYFVKYEPKFIREASWCAEKLKRVAPYEKLEDEIAAISNLS